MLVLSALAAFFAASALTGTIQAVSASAALRLRRDAHESTRHVARDTTYIQTYPLPPGAQTSNLVAFSSIDESSALSAIEWYLRYLFNNQESQESPYYMAFPVELEGDGSTMAGGMQIINNPGNFGLCKNYANENLGSFAQEMAGYIYGEMQKDNSAGSCFYFFCDDGGGYFGAGVFAVPVSAVDLQTVLQDLVANC